MNEKLSKLFKAVDKATDQGNIEYDFGYDVAQKVLFVLTLLALWALPWSWGQYEFAIFIFCCIAGRLLVMTSIQEWINKTIEDCGGRKSEHRFLHMSSGLWKLIVLIFLVIITVRCFYSCETATDVITTIPCCLVMIVCGFFIYAGTTNTVATPPDPTKVGTAAWKKANGVEQVGFDWAKPMWRDKHGNYYEGRNFRPIPPPVHIINKKK